MKFKTYGKNCVTIIHKYGFTIYSYDTPVLRVVNKNYRRLWDGYSATTLKHINMVLFDYGYEKLSKQEWDQMKVETA